MKICKNCGMEYGSDSSFCPYCDKRYGVVITENDVICADFPAYSEEFPPIGETCITEESFVKNRDKIYTRNIHLATDDKYLHTNDVSLLYKSAVPVFKTDKNGDIIPYSPIVEPTVKKNVNNSKSKLTFGNISCILAVLAIFIFIGKTWHNGLNKPDHYINPPFPEVSESEFYDETPSINERPKYLLLSAPSAGKITKVYGSDGKSFMYIMHKPDNGYWDYQFQYYNQGETNADFTKLFANCDEFKNFTEMLIEYPNSDATGVLLIKDGIPNIETENLYLPSSKHYSENRAYYCTVKYDDIVLGHFTSQTPINPDDFEFNDKENCTPEIVRIPQEITVTSESGLEMKLTYKYKQIYGSYKYNFEFTNTTEHDIDNFFSELIGAEYTDKFYALRITNSEESEPKDIIYWNKGIPQSDQFYTVKAGQTVKGTVILDFSDED